MTNDLESLIAAAMPGDSSFRFEALNTYKDCSGKGLNEMDFVWWERNGTLYLLESFSASAYGGQPLDDFLNLCAEKITDSLLFLASAWVPTNYGQNINRELNQLSPGLPAYSNISGMSINVVIDKTWRHDESPSVIALTDELNSIVSGKTALFDTDRVSVLDLEYARIELPDIFGNI